MPYGRLPLTYDECRARFRRSVIRSGHICASESITALGPAGQELTIDWTRIGPDRAERVLVLMSGTHGVEGPANSAIQCDLLDRLDPSDLRNDMAIVMVHAINPWGMAWWRRQNESNVDLNRNWGRDRQAPFDNPGYVALHPLICPVSDTAPDANTVLKSLLDFVERNGLPWVRDSITMGQYTHPDGLHFGGRSTEESTAALERIMTSQFEGAELVLALDLHTGHGEYGTYTLLSDQPLGSDQDTFLRTYFRSDRIEATLDNPQATTGAKHGQLAAGLSELTTAERFYSSAFEIGTATEQEQILATLGEHWVSLQGDRTTPANGDLVWTYRCCFTPDDPNWERAAIQHGRDITDSAIAAVSA